jgi:hypothetical protein
MISIYGELYTEDELYHIIQYYKNSQLKIKSEQVLTQNIDTNTLILYQLDGMDLYNACLSNVYLNRICYKDPILRKKVDLIKKIIKNPPINKLTYANIIIFLTGDIERNFKISNNFNNSIVYRDLNGFILNFVIKNYDSIIKKIIVKGPIEMTTKDLVKLIIDNLLTFDYTIYGRNLIETIEKGRNNEYYIIF